MLSFVLKIRAGIDFTVSGTVQASKYTHAQASVGLAQAHLNQSLTGYKLSKRRKEHITVSIDIDSNNRAS